MLLKQIRYFAAVAETSSFTEAAEKCFISQSAISQQIKSLETELGTELIHRENRSFSLTQAGNFFYRKGLVLLDEADRLVRETMQIGKYEDEHLKIGYLRSYGGNEMHMAVEIFTEKYPDVNLEVAVGDHEELFEMLRTDNVDMVLSDQRRAFSDDYVNQVLVEVRYGIEISGRSEISNLEYVTAEELRKIPCIVVCSKEQQENEKDFYRKILGMGEEFLFADNIEEGRLLVVGNRGFMPVEELSEARRNFGGSIRRIPLYSNGQQIIRKYCAFRKNNRTNYYAEEFADILHEQFENANKIN
jgi:DNA-binding transcriptional LysR family regulator